MKIILNEKQQSDHSGPVIEFIAENDGDAFNLGLLFEKLHYHNACVWQVFDIFDNSIRLRIPLVLMDEIGLAITYKKED